MVRKNCLGFIFIFVCCFVSSCNIINPHETVPTYVHIDSFVMKGNGAITPVPAITSQITTVWAYYNDNPIGIFDLPANIPVMAKGTGKMTLAPGIAADGQNSFLTVYPFYQYDTFNLVSQPTKIVPVIPQTSFYSKIVCQNNIAFRLDSTATVALSGSPGNYHIHLVDAVDSGEYYSTSTYPITVGAECYLEFDYMCTNSFYVGAQSNLSNSGIVYKEYLAGIFPSATWQKFYLTLRDFVSNYKGTDYTFFIKASLDPGVTTGDVYIKNIQLIHF